MTDFELTEKEKVFSSNFVKHDVADRLAIFDRLMELHKVELSYRSFCVATMVDTNRLIAICRDNIC